MFRAGRPPSNTYTFSVFSDTISNPLAVQGVLPGNIEITNFKPIYTNVNADTLVLKLAPDFFKEVISGYTRVITAADLTAKATFTYTPTGTAISFAGESLEYGSIKTNLTLSSFNNINVVVEYDYIASAPVTRSDVVAEPLIFSTTGGQASDGIYGNVLDQFYDNLALGSVEEVYSVSSQFSQLSLLSASSPLTRLLSNHGSQSWMPSNLGLSTPNRLFQANGGTTTIFDQFGTGLGFATSPLLALITISPYDLFTSDQAESLDLVVAQFDGTHITDTNTGAGGILMSTETSGSYLYGQYGEETMIGGNEAGTLSLPIHSVFAELSSIYGNNLIINTNPGNIAYGQAPDIILNVQTSFSNYLSYDFGANAFYVVGTVYGFANSYTLNLENGSAMSGTGSIFGPVTIFGDGTIYGNFNTFSINLDPTANFFDNVFTFAPTQIAITGNDHSTIYTNINEFNMDITTNSYQNSVIFSDSIVVTGNGGSDIYSGINDLSNTAFWNSQLTAITTDAFQDIGNINKDHISVAAFNQNNYPTAITWGNNTFFLGEGADVIHLNLLDAAPSTNGASQWSPANGFGYPILPGNVVVNDFDVNMDIIQFNITPSIYNKIHNAVDSISVQSLSKVTATDINANPSASNISVTNPDGATLTLQFLNNQEVYGNQNDNGFGTLTLHGDTGIATTLAGISPNVRVGTTHVGVDGTVDTFSFFVPITANHVGTDLSTFTEYSQINQFTLGEDYLHIALPKNIYTAFSDNGTLSGSINSNALEFGIQNEGQIQRQFNAETGDTSIGFFGSSSLFSSGEVTLHNVDLSFGLTSTLGDHLNFGWIDKGSAGEVIPNMPPPVINQFTIGNSLNPVDSVDFNQFSHIVDFSSYDHLTIYISDTLFAQLGGLDADPLSGQGAVAVNPYSLQNNLSGAHVNLVQNAAEFTPTFAELNGGGSVASIIQGSATIDSVLQFIAADGMTVNGTLTLHNMNLANNLSSLSSHLTIAHA